MLVQKQAQGRMGWGKQLLLMEFLGRHASSISRSRLRDLKDKVQVVAVNVLSSKYNRVSSQKEHVLGGRRDCCVVFMTPIVHCSVLIH
jgi:hypothetical protein